MMRNGNVIIVVCFFAAFGFALSCSANNYTDGELKRNSELAAQSLKKSLDLGQMDAKQVSGLVETRHFTELESWFDDTQRLYENDVLYESYLDKSYQLFDQKNDMSLADLDQWVKQTGSYIAYTARGIYYAQHGLDILGNKYIEETPRENVFGMVANLKPAAEDLKTAIGKNPKSMAAYRWLIKIGKLSPLLYINAGDIMQKAVGVDPRTYYVRYEYLMSLYSKQDGSVLEMNAYVSEKVTPYFSLNPRLWSLQGESQAALAGYYETQRTYDRAIELYTQALKFGDRTDWLTGRAGCYYASGQFEKAMRDYEKVLYYQPLNAEAKKWADQARDNMMKRAYIK